MTKTNRIAVLTVPSPISWIIINAVTERFGPVTVLAEQRMGKIELIRKRMKRQGFIRVLGQMGYVLLQAVIDRRQAHRVAEIKREMKLDTEPNPACDVLQVGSVNSMACRAALAMVKPDVVLVIGTRIIGKDTLRSLDVPVINSHAGWNPKYRGQAGGYWALASGDPEYAGVTVHLVDEGVDTGDILYQDRFAATAADSFSTYYYIQAGVSRRLVTRAIEDALAGRLKPYKSDLPSQQHFHPTLWGYLWTAVTKGVW
ncbi:MAG: formyl transferase [Alphaproteobacteria bacterium]|nr:formyl transferase [Alphaproteobacteria bacterium]